MDARSWQDNAAEFRELDSGEGWPFAILVACSVGDHPDKTSVDGFARAAGAEHTRVHRFVAAWKVAVQRGLVPDAATLGPDDVGRVTVPDVPWREVYRGLGRNSRADHTRRAVEDPAALVAAMNEQQREAVVREIVQVSDADIVREVHRVARDRILDDHESLNRRHATAEQQARDSRKSRHTLRYLETDELITAAARKLREAATIAHEVEFTDTERDDLLESVARARTALDVVTTAIAGGGEVDWDAELARMGAE